MSGRTATRTRTIQGPTSDELRTEAKQALPDGEQWLVTRHPLLSGRTPADCLAAGEVEVVNDLLHSILYVGVS